MKRDKHDSSSKPVPTAMPQKDACAIEPPKKVIKALYDYTPPADPPIYLAFSTGDFLHVVSREADSDWYEACNPLKNERGLVPVNYFEDVGKTVRDSAGSSGTGNATHDSGYAEGAMGTVRPARGNSAAQDPGSSIGHRPSRSIARGGTGGVYGVVIYDFSAERPDELDAKEGEAIIVIAQSNPEWFVAKPITRLGGPGLIPVSFIEIRDMTTGQAVPNTADAVAKAGIPRVEEWKKMAAEYKNTSIPLGTVSSSQQAQMEQGMDRLSLASQQEPASNGSFRHSRPQMSPENSYQQQQAQNLFAPVRASVPRYIFAEEKFHFIVECKLSNGVHWDLSRIYEDFYELQINLINAFQEEAGQVPGKQRILPYMPGPVKFVTDNISEGRRANLDEYLRDLLRLSQYITCSSLVRNFFAPRPGDYEIDPNAADLDDHARAHEAGARTERHSGHSQSSTLQNGGGYGQPTGSSNGHAYSISQPANGGHQRQQPSFSSTQGHYRSPSSLAQHGPHPYGQPPPPQGYGSTPSLSQSHPAHSAPAGANVKVKAWFDRDTCVVIRMPPRGQFTFEDLYRKILERRRLEFKGPDGTPGGRGDSDEEDELDIEYRDEKEGEYYRLEGDEDLDIAVERNEKLTLAVRASGDES